LEIQTGDDGPTAAVVPTEWWPSTPRAARWWWWMKEGTRDLAGVAGRSPDEPAGDDKGVLFMAHPAATGGLRSPWNFILGQRRRRQPSAARAELSTAGTFGSRKFPAT